MPKRLIRQCAADGGDGDWATAAVAATAYTSPRASLHVADDNI